mmetsp:Transcript_22289/g.53998  ORF Transcript_22289/g.53998 Transcript_22289/m.53998 type:complete len:421 (-) Transcript_22289:301-1563(-)|eukprot:CAMPEP_0181095516 /NCGR_PEP_ID=MMETSP1071-20121207/10557_1 /TAXON_ID=35127 /ORGANISM="Thalassiosira sp., Strain NH16" /LENGTH=420 /DNA_ID=CAMNT_0023177895 /DNA_START=80 /DNA_END=1342 /DNA_ORIENTATION=+
MGGFRLSSLLSRRPSSKVAIAAGQAPAATILGKKVDSNSRVASPVIAKQGFEANALDDSTRSSSKDESDEEIYGTLSSAHSDSLTSFAGNLSPHAPREAIVPPNEIGIQPNNSMRGSLGTGVHQNDTFKACLANEDERFTRESSLKVLEKQTKEHAATKRPATTNTAIKQTRAKTCAKAPKANIVTKEGINISSLDESDTQTVMTDDLTMRNCLLTNLECIDTSFNTSFNIDTFRVIDSGAEDAEATGLITNAKMFDGESNLVETEGMDKKNKQQFDEHDEKRNMKAQRRKLYSSRSEAVERLNALNETKNKQHVSSNGSQSDNSDDDLSIDLEANAPSDPEEGPTSATAIITPSDKETPRSVAAATTKTTNMSKLRWQRRTNNKPTTTKEIVSGRSKSKSREPDKKKRSVPRITTMASF